MRIEAPENRSLPSMLAPQLRLVLLRLSRKEQVKHLAERGLRALASFAKALKIKYDDLEVGLDFLPEPGLADNGDLEHNLQTLIELIGAAAQQAGTALIMFIDELQYVKENELAVLITALHRVAQRQLPVLLVGAGLPQLPGRLGRAKSYAERLFDFSVIGPLPVSAATLAIRKPVEDLGVKIQDEAIAMIYAQTRGYAYFLQEWGKHSWDIASTPLITADDVEKASVTAVAALDDSFFKVRWNRINPAEKRYLRAMAELGPGPHRSGDIAAELGGKVTSYGPVRSQLIDKGMIYSPSHGDTAFTVPLFNEFMQRIIPGSDWRR